MKYYFFKSVLSKGRNRLRPLSGQVFPTGEMVDATFNVAADREIRSKYPMGTTFGSDTLSDNGSYYTAGQLSVMSIPAGGSPEPQDCPNEDMKRAYNIFLSIDSDDSDYKVKTEPIEDPTLDDKAPKKKKKSYLDKMKQNKNLNVPTIESDGFYVDEKQWYLLLRNIQNQVNTMMIGATGSGKTELVILACKKLNVPCHVYDMGSMYDPIAGLLGVHRLSEKGTSVFDYAKFTQDIQEPGVILLDELSRAPVTTNNILFPCLDSRRTLPVEIAGGKDMRSIKVNDECTFIATANVGAEYTGTNSMDKALVNRFFPLELSYMPANQEGLVLHKRTGVTIDTANKIVEVANQVRTLYRKQELSSSISTRETLMVANLVNDGWALIDAMELVYLPIFEGTDSEGERSMVRKIFASF